MSEKNKTEDKLDIQLTEILLGADEEFENEEVVDEFLDALGIEPKSLVNNFASFLETRAKDENNPKRSEKMRSAAAYINQAQKLKHQVNNSQVSIKKSTSHPEVYWTNSSVLMLAEEKEQDPLQIITSKARQVILDFAAATDDTEIQQINPFAIAQFRGIAVTPREDVRDSRTIYRNGKFIIEYNPNRPRPRIRYSICHEIVHTLFPDCSEKIRHRATHEEMQGDDWQLEMLCNVGAGELLMPLGSLKNFDEQILSIESLMGLRKKFEVSTESLFLRLLRVVSLPFAVFSASRKQGEQHYQIDYLRSSKFWSFKVPSGFTLPKNTIIKNCTAIGHTAIGIEKWSPRFDQFRIEAVGIPPHPEQTLPRVMGIIRPVNTLDIIGSNQIQYVRGDATKPHETGSYRIIAHLVNDKTANWGGAFAQAVRRKWSLAQTAFQEWAAENRSNLALGNVHFIEVEPGLLVATMVCQKGYGDSKKSRLRYNFLKICLDKVAEFAKEKLATVHMPRIGSGQARGNWEIITELIEDALSESNITVYVYTLPNAEIKQEAQKRFDFFGGEKD